MDISLILCMFLLSVSARVQLSNAWGKDGHFILCKIAEQYLTKEASEAVQKLLPAVAEGELASVCSWADQVRFRYRWASPLHYVNTPGVCNYDYTRDCHNSMGVQNMCVAGAINNYTAQLLTFQEPHATYNLTESLMFLSHFVGDIHQPLHVSFEADKGGNSIAVRWYRRKSNLHRVWDVEIIVTAMKDFYDRERGAMIDAIKKNITSNDIDQWTCSGSSEECTDLYASESITLACDYAYKDVTDGSTLTDEYFLSRLPIVQNRLAQGGLRLAAILNKILGVNSQEITLKLPSERNLLL